MAVSIVIYSEDTCNTRSTATKVAEREEFMKKKLVALTLSLALALSLAACGGKKEKADTAETEATTATTETSVASTEKTEEVEPVAEESQEEKTVEEKLPTDVNGIQNYLKENGKVGDYIISEDEILVVKTTETQTEKYPVKIIDGKAYRTNIISLNDGNMIGLITSKLQQDAKLSDPNVDIENMELQDEITRRLYDEYLIDIPVYVRIEPTDDPNTVKMTYIISDQDMEWFNENILTIAEQKETLLPNSKNEYGDWMIISYKGTCICATMNDFKNNKLTLTVSLSDININIEEGNKTPEILTNHVDQDIIYTPILSSSFLNKRINHTLVTD